MNLENKTKINFSQNLFTYNELVKLITATYSYEKVDIIKHKLRKHILINHKEYYIFDSVNTLYYKIDVDDKKEFILMNIRKLLEISHSKLEDKERENFDLKYSKIVSNLLKSTYAKDYVNDIICDLVRDNVDFYDPNKYEIHFRNGYFDLKAFEFKPRDQKKHFISVYINRDFKIPDAKIIDEVEKLTSQIIPNQDDKNYIFKDFGASLTGDVIDAQSNLFFLGKGATGKSTLMKLLKFAIDVYMLELKNNTFTQGNTKIDKILNEFKEKTYLRIAWINEMEDKKLDQSLFKSFCEGLLQSTSLYKDGLNNFKHFCKLIFTANTFPRIIIDGGTVRRIDAYEMKALFVDNEKDVNEEKNIFLKNTNALKQIEDSDEIKNAFFYIIAKYSSEWLKDKNKYKKTENFKETKDKVVNINDVIGEFLQDNITITKNDDDRISKIDMYNLFKEANPKSLIDPTQLMSILNNKDIEFSFKKRLDGKQGCYIGVKLKEVGSQNSDIDYGLENEEPKKSENEELKQALLKIQQLEKQIEDMKKQLNDKKEDIKEDIKVEVKEEVKEDIKEEVKVEVKEDIKEKKKKVKKNKSTKSSTSPLDYGVEGHIDEVLDIPANDEVIDKEIKKASSRLIKQEEYNKLKEDLEKFF